MGSEGGFLCQPGFTPFGQCHQGIKRVHVFTTSFHASQQNVLLLSSQGLVLRGSYQDINCSRNDRVHDLLLDDGQVGGVGLLVRLDTQSLTDTQQEVLQLGIVVDGDFGFPGLLEQQMPVHFAALRVDRVCGNTYPMLLPHRVVEVHPGFRIIHQTNKVHEAVDLAAQSIVLGFHRRAYGLVCFRRINRYSPCNLQ